MSTKRLVVLSLVLVSGVVTAQQGLTTVEVYAETERSLTIACNDPSTPSLKDVESVLSVNDPALTPGLRTKLMAAAAEACTAGESKIEVTRTASGKSFTWKPVS